MRISEAGCKVVRFCYRNMRTALWGLPLLASIFAPAGVCLICSRSAPDLTKGARGFFAGHRSVWGSPVGTTVLLHHLPACLSYADIPYNLQHPESSPAVANLVL